MNAVPSSYTVDATSSIQELEKELTMAHLHIDVIEEDKCQLQHCVNYLLELYNSPRERDTTPAQTQVEAPTQTQEHTTLLDDSIIQLLKQGGSTSRDILRVMKQILPQLSKGDINSRLYSYLTNGRVKKITTDGAPKWCLVQ